jgi:hypothetical protein
MHTTTDASEFIPMVERLGLIKKEKQNIEGK